MNTDELHPAVLPLSSNMDRFRRRPLPEESVNEDGFLHLETPPMLQGIDMSRYSEFHETEENENEGDSDNLDNINHERMYTSLAYSVLRERNASLAVQNDESVDHIREAHLDSLLKLELLYSAELEKKRQRIEEINEGRKKRQIEFQPVNEYLDEKWHDGINSMIDMGIQRRGES